MIDLISTAILRAAAPERTQAELTPWVAPIKAACLRFEINTARRVAAFIAQMAHESGLMPRNESLNYRVEALLSLFGRHRISAADAQRLGRKPGEGALSLSRQEQIGNLIYGGEYGRTNLGNTQPGDGWTFRGAGPLQITGRHNATAFAGAIGKPLTEALAYMRTIDGGIMATAWFWEENDINRLADTPGVADETRRINGGINGLEDRKARFDRTVAALLAAQ
jgi:putative chitinase